MARYLAADDCLRSAMLRFKEAVADVEESS